MIRSTGLRIALGVLAVNVGLGILHFKPWQRAEASANRTRKELEVAYLPVT
jgi:hypothetical protein